MSLRFFKSITIFLLLFLLLTTIGFQPAFAMDRSRAFVCLLFLSGLGTSAAGAVIQGQANETYDRYLHTAVQSDMESLIDDYDRKHQQSIIASRAGIGLVVGAILLSLIDAAHIPPPEAQGTSVLFGEYGHAATGSETSYSFCSSFSKACVCPYPFGDQIVIMDTQNGEILLAVLHRF